MKTDDGVTMIVLNIGLFCTVSYPMKGVALEPKEIEVTYKGRRIPSVVHFAFATHFNIHNYIGNHLPRAHFEIDVSPETDLDTDFIEFLKKEGISFQIFDRRMKRW
jgi:hypothetical protein